MTFETKYGIGDEVWYLGDNGPVSEVITMIKTEVWKNNQYTIYRSDSSNKDLYENRLFETKKEAMLVLIDQYGLKIENNTLIEKE